MELAEASQPLGSRQQQQRQHAAGQNFGSEVAVEEIMAQVQAAAQGQTDGTFAKSAENTVFRVRPGARARLAES